MIDGDLCEQFPTLPPDLQRKIADELDRTPGEILKKLEDIRNKIIWNGWNLDLATDFGIVVANSYYICISVSVCIYVTLSHNQQFWSMDRHDVRMFPLITQLTDMGTLSHICSLHVNEVFKIDIKWWEWTRTPLRTQFVKYLTWYLTFNLILQIRWPDSLSGSINNSRWYGSCLAVYSLLFL